jgi:hypothetical protein
MKVFRQVLGQLLAVSLLVLASAGAHAEKIALKADLEAASEVPPVHSSGHGTLTGTFDTDSKVFTYHVTFEDLTGPAVAAHFHGPAMAGKTAGPQLPIKVKPLVSPIDGTGTLTAAQAKELLAGEWYINVHTAKNPGGEIRGQVERAM